jgi:hypothetical protein
MAGGGDGGSLRVSERENIRPSANFSNFCLQGNRVSQDTAVGGGGDKGILMKGSFKPSRPESAKERGVPSSR